MMASPASPPAAPIARTLFRSPLEQPHRSRSPTTMMRLLAAAVLLGAADAAIDKDEIKSLPGWDGALPSRHWSGYLEVPGSKGGVEGEGSKFYHYWFVESEGNPKTDPVALWLNGGPGSSSLIGFLTENGPFETKDASLTENTTATPKLFHRETGWQKAASYIFLESPAGVGFSYCDYDNCTASDTSTAIDNHRVLKKFFAGFPEFAKNDFYITGESYAGVYCPTLAEQIMNDASNAINLKGLAVGNGCWGSKVGLCAFGADMDRINAQFLYGHGAYSKAAYKAIVEACGDPADGPNAWGGSPTPATGTEKYKSKACQAARNEADSNVGSFEIYNYCVLSTAAPAIDRCHAAAAAASGMLRRRISDLAVLPPEYRRLQMTHATAPLASRWTAASAPRSSSCLAKAPSSAPPCTLRRPRPSVAR
jgi:hypothetical protein